MNLEELQEAWSNQGDDQQDHLLGAQPPELLVARLRRKRRSFERIVFWRDLREAGIAFPVAAFFAYCGWITPIWSFYVLAGCCAFVGIFITVDHLRQRKKRASLAEPVLANIASALGEVEHQIWLLRAVIWWYLLPFFIGLAMTSVHMALTHSHNSGEPFEFPIVQLVVFAALYATIYFLNQVAVHLALKPRRAELAALLESLKYK